MILYYFLKEIKNICQAHVCDTKLDNPLWFSLSRIKDKKDFFIAEINGGEMMSKGLNMYIAALSYAGKTLFVLLDPRIIVSFC